MSLSFLTGGGLRAGHIKYHHIIGVPLTRQASTSSRSDNHNDHHHWPKAIHPTPYEVLNINSKSFSIPKLRKQYFRLAKVYHPDTSSANHLEDHKGRVLTIDHKNERFKLLTEAYTLLKDPRKKATYDQYKVGWGSAGNHLYEDAFSSQRNTYAHQKYYTSQDYWSAGNWEDYQNLHKNEGMAGSEDNQGKMKVLAVIICFMIGSATLQGWYILESVEKSILEHKRVNDKTELDLDLAYTNYGLDTTKMSRIRRFLWFRSFGLYREKEHLDQSSKQNESLIREIMGEVE